MLQRPSAKLFDSNDDNRGGSSSQTQSEFDSLAGSQSQSSCYSSQTLPIQQQRREHDGIQSSIKRPSLRSVSSLASYQSNIKQSLWNDNNNNNNNNGMNFNRNETENLNPNNSNSSNHFYSNQTNNYNNNNNNHYNQNQTNTNNFDDTEDIDMVTSRNFQPNDRNNWQNGASNNQTTLNHNNNINISANNRNVTRNEFDNNFNDNFDDLDEFENDNNKNKANSDKIQVLVRVRPLLTDIESNSRVCTIVDSKLNSISIDCKPNAKQFSYDYVMNSECTQEQVFQLVGKPITNCCLRGYNGTIFAYGQTGSGKTYSIEGDLNSSSRRGLMPRVFDYLFSQLLRRRNKLGWNNFEYLVKCSCLEIYNEKIQDLFAPEKDNLSIREDIKKGVFVENLTELNVQNANECINCVEVASRNRRLN